MAEMTILLRRDPQTGRQNIIVKLDGDADALPHEHEQRHRRLVEKLIGKGLVQAEEIGELVIEREQQQAEPVAPQAQPQAEPQKQKQGRG